MAFQPRLVRYKIEKDVFCVADSPGWCEERGMYRRDISHGDVSAIDSGLVECE